jgi:hypothetical protein
MKTSTKWKTTSKKMKDDLNKWKTTSKKLEGDLKKNWKTTYKKRMEDKLRKMEDNLKTNKNERQPQAQFKKSAFIGCDIIVN